MATRGAFGAAGLAVTAILLSTGCGPSGNDSSATAPTSNASPSQVSTKSAEPAAPAYVPTFCEGMARLFADLEAQKAQITELVTKGESAAAFADLGRQWSSNISALGVSLAGAEQPTFEDADLLVARVEAELAKLVAAVDSITSTIETLNPADPNYDTAVAGQGIGLAMAPLALALAVLDGDAFAGSPAVDQADLITRSAGALGFYREARVEPRCASFFSHYSAEELAAIDQVLATN
jgi:hypothetical protein